MKYLRYSPSIGFCIALWLFWWLARPDVSAFGSLPAMAGAALLALVFALLQLLTGVIYRYHATIEQRRLTLLLTFLPPLALVCAVVMGHANVAFSLPLFFSLVAYQQCRHMQWWSQCLFMLPLFSFMGIASLVALGFFIIGLWGRRRDITIAPLRALVFLLTVGLWIYFFHAHCYISTEPTTGIVATLSLWVGCALFLILARQLSRY